MTPIIQVRGLAKRYVLGEPPVYRLQENIMRAAAAPMRLARRVLGRGNGATGVAQYDELWALRGVSFEVTAGEILGIIGRNGAGKSTLLKILSRITRPTEGSVALQGRIGSLLEVGTGFHGELTGRENIFLNGAILGMRRAEIARKFDEIVDFSGVERFIDTPVKRYSSGMWVRLAFAVAAHLEPEILLIDEALAVGDLEFQKKCLGKMGEISREGRTVLLVSHNLPSVVNLCQRAILLENGNVTMDGSPADVVQKYIVAARSGGGEVVWPRPAEAPGDHVARLHAVRILQEGIEGPTADVDIAKEIIIQIVFWNLVEGAPLYPAIWLRDQMGTPVLSSSNQRSVSLTEDCWQGMPHPAGLYESVCRIPANFLNEGNYNITAIIGEGVAVDHVLREYALTFQVHDSGAMRKEFVARWIGVVRPRLAWRTSRLDNDGPGPSGR